MIDLFTTKQRIELLRKAASVVNPTDLNSDELDELAKLLKIDDLLSNFTEAGIRSFKNDLSGQPLFGVATHKVDGTVISYSFIPPENASRGEMYDGLLYFIISPAARNLARRMFSFSVSDFATMRISEISAWGSLADTLSSVRDWSKYLDLVMSPGEILRPISVEYDFLAFSKIKSELYSPSYIDSDEYEKLLAT